MWACKHLHQWDITEPVLKYLNRKFNGFLTIIFSWSPYLQILTDYLLENFGCRHTVSTVWLEKVSPRRFALLKIFLEDDYYILACASCRSGEYNTTFQSNSRSSKICQGYIFSVDIRIWIFNPNFYLQKISYSRVYKDRTWII